MAILELLQAMIRRCKIGSNAQAARALAGGNGPVGLDLVGLDVDDGDLVLVLDVDVDLASRRVGDGGLRLAAEVDRLDRDLVCLGVDDGRRLPRPLHVQISQEEGS